MNTSHFSLSGIVFLAIIAIVQFSPTQIAMAQCGVTGGYTGFGGPSHIGFDLGTGQPQYQGFSGQEWDFFQRSFDDTLDRLPPKDFFGFLFPENVFAQCGNTNPPAATPSVTLTATPGSVSSGGVSVLSWSSQNVVTCTGDGFFTGGSTSGSVNVTPSNTTTYTITCSTTSSGGASGTWQSSASYTTDYACPLSNSTVREPHANVPDCPTGSPSGDSCSPTGSTCKVNTAAGCNVDTEIYSCEAGGGSCVANGELLEDGQGPAQQDQYLGFDDRCCSGAFISGGQYGNDKYCRGRTGTGGAQTVTDSATVTVGACTPAYNASRWYTGGTQVAVSSVEMGYSAADCATITPGNITYTHWNRQVQYQEGGVPQFDPVRTMCWYYNAASGTESKPGVTQGDWYTHYDSGSTCTVPAIPQCSNGEDDDGDGDTDFTEDGGCENGLDDDELGDTLPQCSDGEDNNGGGGEDYPNDPSCTSPDDDTEDGVTAGTSCSVDASTVSAGGTTTYRATAQNGATAPFTWTPSGQTNCSGGANNTCTFPGTGPYSMSVRAQGAATPTSCPIVTAGCAGPSELSITANGEEEDVRVKDGRTALIEWEVSGTAATSCTVTENGAVIATPSPNACNVTGQATRTINTQMTYVLTCGSETDVVIVNVDTSLLEF